VNLTVTKLVVFTGCAMLAALGGSFYGAWSQAITPLDFMWSTSLELLLLVVLGGRSVISGAIIAGGVVAVQALPGIPVGVNQFLTLSIALGVIGLAQEPEGTVRMTSRQITHVLAVLKPLPQRHRAVVVGSRGVAPRVPSPAEVTAPSADTDRQEAVSGVG
jgi:hypothetical protein